MVESKSKYKGYWRVVVRLPELYPTTLSPSMPGRAVQLQQKKQPKQAEEKPHWIAARAAAAELLREIGLPKQGDGRQRKLEDYIAQTLAALGVKPVPVKSTIRRYAKRFISEFGAR